MRRCARLISRSEGHRGPLHGADRILSLRRALHVVAIFFAVALPPSLQASLGIAEPLPAEQPELDRTQSDSPETDPARRREAALTRLFESLAEAGSPEMAHGIEQLIWTIWLQTDNERAKAFMSIALQSMNEQDFSSARLFLDRTIEVDPGFAEAWNKRATLSFIEGDYASSLADIARVLELEPRHFGALNGLGMIMERAGRKKEALAAFRRALAIYPQMTLIQERVEALSREVEGPEL